MPMLPEPDEPCLREHIVDSRLGLDVNWQREGAPSPNYEEFLGIKGDELTVARQAPAVLCLRGRHKEPCLR